MSEYLDEEEQLARMKSWWDENGTFLVVAVVVMVAGIVGYSWYGSHSTEQNQAGTRLLQEYTEAAPGSEERAASLAAIEDGYSGSAVHVLTLFDQAGTAVDEGDFDAANAALGKIVEGGADDLLVDLARLRQARVLMQLDLKDQALSALAAVRNEGYRTLAMEIKGDVLAASGDLAGAHESYEAALATLEEGQQRPILELKAKNLQPFNGEYVELTDNLATALEAAAQELDDATPAADEAAAAEAVEGAAESANGEVEEAVVDATEAAAEEAPATDTQD